MSTWSLLTKGNVTANFISIIFLTQATVIHIHIGLLTVK